VEILGKIRVSSFQHALLRHADLYLHPSWSNGGLYYARNDVPWDKDGNLTFVNPYTGNAGSGYARLNVKDGQKKMWDHPWTPKEVESRPWIDGVQLDQNVDCLRGKWDEEQHTMIATFKTWDRSGVRISPLIKSLPIRTYGVYVDGELKREVLVKALGDEIVQDLEVGEEEITLVVLRA